jgi:MFS family permease
MVIFALVPYLALSAALDPITPIIAKDLHMSLQAMSLASGMANAGYAVGTVLAVLLAQHLPQRRMLVLYAALLVLGSVLAAAAPDAGFFIAGHVLQGLCTSLLLIAAVPPLVVSFPLAKLRWTAIILNVCIFGAVALGPLVGGIQAQANGWRPLFWIIAGIAAAALVLSLLTFQDAPPADRSATRNPLPVAMAAAGCVALFYGASELLTHPFVDAATLVPLAGGLTLIVLLLVYQYHAKRPLLCIRPLGSTLPVSGIVVAMCAAASSISAVALAAVLLTDKFSPVHLGLLQFPEFIAALITAAALGVVFRTRGLHYLVLGGMLSLIAGILVLQSELPPSSLRMAIGSGLVGLGVGGCSSPASRCATTLCSAFSRSSSCCGRLPHSRSARCWCMWLRPSGGARRRAPGPRCGSASGSRAAARCSRSPFTRSAEYARRRRRWRHGRAARRRRGTRRRCLTESVTPPKRRSSPNRWPVTSAVHMAGHATGTPRSRRPVRLAQ